MLIVVVILARSGNMPVVIPEKINDFIIDTTESFLSGDFFHSFHGFMNDTADYVNKGEKAVNLKNELKSYQLLLNNYFSLTKKNLLYLASRDKIRRSLPDFKKSLSTLFAKNILSQIIDNYHDVDQISLIRVNKSVVVRVKRDKVNLFNERSIAFSKIRHLRKIQGVSILILPANRFCLITHVFSKMREKEGYLVIVLNQNQIKTIFARRHRYKKDFVPFLYNKNKMLFVSGLKSKGANLLKNKLFDSRVSIDTLKNRTYADLGDYTYRIALGTLLSKDNFYLGVIGLEGTIFPFITLMARFLLLLLALGLLIFLIKLIYRTVLELIKHDKFADDFNELLLKKSIETNRKVLNAAEVSYQSTVIFMESMQKNNDDLKKIVERKKITKVKVVKSCSPKNKNRNIRFLEIPFDESKKLKQKEKSSNLEASVSQSELGESLLENKELLEMENYLGHPDFKDDLVIFKPIEEKYEDWNY